MSLTTRFTLAAVALGLLAGAAAEGPARAAPSSETSSTALLQAAEGRLPAFLHCLREQEIAIVGAHRGGPRAEFPENAIATMARVTTLAPVFIETDVQESRDGVLFMNHDDILDRNTTGAGRVADHDWAEISRLKQRDPTAQPTAYAPPRLSQVLQWSRGRALLLLDVKPSTEVEKVIAEVEAEGAEGRVMYLAYTADQAHRTLARAPDAVVAVPMLNRDYFDRMREAGLVGPHILGMVNVNRSDPQLVSDIAATGTIVLSGSYAGADTPDAVYESLADAPAYHAMIGRGAQMIASNRPVHAGAAMSAYPDYARRLGICAVRD